MLAGGESGEFYGKRDVFSFNFCASVIHSENLTQVFKEIFKICAHRNRILYCGYELTNCHYVDLGKIKSTLAYSSEKA